MGLAIKMANATRAAMFEQRKEEVERLARPGAWSGASGSRRHTQR